ncbi:MAG: Rrf2 family transcriptional regulator [Patescibacteria group bacterium]
MIKISREVDYAIQLLLRLAKAKKEEYVGLKKFCTESSISFLFLQKIARQLRQAGFIQAAKGPAGGYRLARDIESISLKSLIEALDDHAGPTACLRGEFCVKERNCTLKPGMGIFHTKLNSLMEQTSIVDFV